jgi:hypothetical protein
LLVSFVIKISGCFTARSSGSDRQMELMFTELDLFDAIIVTAGRIVDPEVG